MTLKIPFWLLKLLSPMPDTYEYRPRVWNNCSNNALMFIPIQQVNELSYMFRSPSDHLLTVFLPLEDGQLVIEIHWIVRSIAWCVGKKPLSVIMLDTDEQSTSDQSKWNIYVDIIESGVFTLSAPFSKKSSIHIHSSNLILLFIRQKR